jgi:urocanate hydratase
MEAFSMITNQDISNAMMVKLEDLFTELPAYPEFEKGIRRAPKRNLTLNQDEVALALKNALRYIPEKWH